MSIEVFSKILVSTIVAIVTLAIICAEIREYKIREKIKKG